MSDISGDDNIEVKLSLNSQQFNEELKAAEKKIKQFTTAMENLNAKGFLGSNFQMPQNLNGGFFDERKWALPGANGLGQYYSKTGTGFLASIKQAQQQIEQQFADELKMIKDPAQRKNFVGMLANTGFTSSFFQAPASTSGNYHPWMFREEGGLANHSKAVAQTYKQLAQAKGLTDKEIDEGIMFALGHDYMKVNANGTYNKDHDAMMGAQFKKFGLDPDAVANHMTDAGQSEQAKLLHYADMLVSRTYASDAINFDTDKYGNIAGIRSVDIAKIEQEAMSRGDLQGGRWKYDLETEAKQIAAADAFDADVLKKQQKAEDAAAKIAEREQAAEARRQLAGEKKYSALFDKRDAEEDAWWKQTAKEKDAEDKAFARKHDKEQNRLQRVFDKDAAREAKEVAKNNKDSENSWFSMLSSIGKFIILAKSLQGIYQGIEWGLDQTRGGVGHFNGGLGGLTGLTQQEQYENRTASRAFGLDINAMNGLAVDFATRYSAFKTTGQGDFLSPALLGQLDNLYSDSSLSTQGRMWGALDAAYNSLSGMSGNKRAEQLKLLQDVFGSSGTAALSVALEAGRMPSSYLSNDLLSGDYVGDVAARNRELAASLAELDEALSVVTRSIGDSITELIGLDLQGFKLTVAKWFDDLLKDAIELKENGIATTGISDTYAGPFDPTYVLNELGSSYAGPMGDELKEIQNYAAAEGVSIREAAEALGYHNYTQEAAENEARKAQRVLNKGNAARQNVIMNTAKGIDNFLLPGSTSYQDAFSGKTLLEQEKMLTEIQRALDIVYSSNFENSLWEGGNKQNKEDRQILQELLDVIRNGGGISKVIIEDRTGNNFKVDSDLVTNNLGLLGFS